MKKTVQGEEKENNKNPTPKKETEKILVNMKGGGRS